MSFGNTLARNTINTIMTLDSTALSQVFPFKLMSRALTNRVVPWIAYRAYRPGDHDVNGIRMRIPPPPKWGGGGEHHMALGTYEMAEIEFVTTRLKPGDTFLDVGAHIGYFALPAAKRVGTSGRVVALEPTPKSFELLKENVASNGFDQVTLINAAASDRDGTATFTVSDRSAMWNTLQQGTLKGDNPSEIQVQTRSLDSVLAELGWPAVAGIKLDVEGAEAAVLQGATETLRRNPRSFVLFEISGGTPERIKVSMETLRWFESRGYGFRPMVRRAGDRLVKAADLEPRLHQREWYRHLLNVSAELSQ
jgi:FkbM family methyltransferase